VRAEQVVTIRTLVTCQQRRLCWHGICASTHRRKPDFDLVPSVASTTVSLVEGIATLSGMILLSSTAAVTVWTVLYAQVFRRSAEAPLSNELLPRTAVLMGLKGTDPYLRDGLRRLMTQNYPDYEVRIVVDSRDDPAWPLVEEAIRDTNAKHVSIIEYRESPEHGIVNCTNSKVVQALRGLDDSFEAIAMADGDVVANENWLTELISPLARDPKIGVTTGNRWFIPPRMSAGNLVRHLWNVATTSIMYHLRMPWGGCYGIRMSAIRDGGLVDKWAKVAALDMHTTSEMKTLGLKVQFVPSLMMVNREESPLPAATNWIRRQLTWARLYNPGWWFVVVHTSVAAVAMAVAIVATTVGAFSGFTEPTLWAASGLFSYLLGMTALVALLEVCIRQRLRVSGQTIEPLQLQTLLPVLLAVPLTQFVQLVATLQATFVKRVAWRGSILEVNGPNDIRVIDNRPTEETTSRTARAA
jgi:cellulose synthase/poly-beta-1,6-N-acetylglucosamine synthase-like glycosyltransferase